ncbi:hypothetical protein [Thalassoroseus pseudoceratinae]|uniref:hypothetical protein n=1 Tax=Thalassoroseus pseudoceratinae TaxID=2713176 RepID=UPI00141F6848|nr:hypothetical protein [Thalassoroseus pseudoceratinae]
MTPTPTGTSPSNTSNRYRSGLDDGRGWRIYNRIAIVFLLYVLSTGPMYWPIYEAYNIGGRSIDRLIYFLYYPIVLLCEFDWIAGWFEWYVGLWNP